ALGLAQVAAVLPVAGGFVRRIARCSPAQARLLHSELRLPLAQLHLLRAQLGLLLAQLPLRPGESLDPLDQLAVGDDELLVAATHPEERVSEPLPQAHGLAQV